jgi:hypothetical protein
MIIQINVFEPPLSVVCVVVVWLGREVCVVVVVVVEEVLLDAGGDELPPPVLEVFWASTGTAAQDRLRISRHALKLLNSRQDFIISSSPFRVSTSSLLTSGGGARA